MSHEKREANHKVVNLLLSNTQGRSGQDRRGDELSPSPHPLPMRVHPATPVA
jgi:hypothetical protein